MHVFRFQQLTESRWATLGEVARALVRITSGAGGLLAVARKQPSTSEYYVRGVDRMTDELRKLMAIVSVVSSAPDSVLTMLLEDDRAMLRLHLWTRNRPPLQQALLGEELLPRAALANNGRCFV